MLLPKGRRARQGRLRAIFMREVGRGGERDRKIWEEGRFKFSQDEAAITTEGKTPTPPTPGILEEVLLQEACLFQQLKTATSQLILLPHN